MLAKLVYLLGAVVTVTSAILLLRGFARSRSRLLLWSGLCFAGLAVSNVLLFVDLVLLPANHSLYMWRLSTAAAAMLLLVYGLVFESE
jgi:Zn-dependent protease